MQTQETNLTELLDDFFGVGKWENQLKDVLFKSMYRNAKCNDSTDNVESEFLYTTYNIISNLITDRNEIEKLGSLEMVTPSVLLLKNV